MNLINRIFTVLIFAPLALAVIHDGLLVIFGGNLFEHGLFFPAFIIMFGFVLLMCLYNIIISTRM